MALAGVVQWIEYQPENQMVVVLIPSQDTCLGCGTGPHLGTCKRQLINISCTDVSLPLFLVPFPSL